MGASGSEPFNEELAGYKVIQRYPENNITHLSHIETDKEYLLREHTYNDENLYKKSYSEHKLRQAIVDDHLTHLGRVQGKQIDHLCSNIYKIYAIWEYPYRFLSEEINERSYQNRKFEDKQIWSILASAILGLSTLQKNKIKHEMLTTKTILLDSDGLIKIADPLACGSSSNMDIVYRNRNSQGIYLSPQQCQALQSRGSYNNPYKNDVWAIGMILLQCGLLRNMSQCYKDEYQRIDYERMHNNLAEFGQEYGEDLRIIVQLMLKRDCKDRPDWIDLQPYARKTNRNTNADITSMNINTNTNANMSFSPLSNNQEQQSSFSPYIPISNNKQSSKVGADYSRGDIKQSFQPRNQDSFRNQPPPIYNNQGFNPALHNPSLNINTNMSQSYGYPAHSNPYGPSTNIIQTPTFRAGSNIMSQTSSLTASVPYQAVSANTSSFGFQPLYRPTQYSASDRMSSAHRGNLFPSPPTSTPTGMEPPLKSYEGWKNTQQLGYQSNIPYNSNITTSIPYSANRPDPLRPDYISTKAEYGSVGKTTTIAPPTYTKTDYTAIGVDTGNKYTSSYLNQPLGLGTTGTYGTTATNIGTSIGTGIGAGIGTGIGAGIGSYNTNPISSTNSYGNNYSSNYNSTSTNKYTSPFTSPPTIPSSTYTSNTNINKPFDNINIGAPTPADTSNNYTTTTTTTTTNAYKFDKQSQHNRIFSSYSNPATNNPLQQYTASKWVTNNTQPLPSSLPQLQTQAHDTNFKYYSTNSEYKPPNASSTSTPIASLTNHKVNHNYEQDIPQPGTNTNNNTHINTNKNTYVDQEPERDHNNNDDERPQFVIQTFKQGSKYQGFKLRDMRHGKGKFYYQDGGMYDGNWTENKMDGFGSLYYQSGELAYQGMWKDDQFQGKGKLFNQSPQEFHGEYNYKNFDQIDEFWEYYQGDFVEDFKKGKGKLMLSNGEYFQGTFNNDMVQGPGAFHCKNGQVIKGVWRQNHLISE